jgi:hypothetical protein
MSPWQLERKNDPRKPQIDSATRTRTRKDGARDERKDADRPDLGVGLGQPIIIDDGE